MRKKNVGTGMNRKRRISVDKVRAIIHATIDNPRIMKELATLKPGLARMIFAKLLELRPAVGMDVLYQAVLGMESVEALHQLVNHALLSMKADDLWCVVLRLAKQWARNDHLPEWDHYGNASREIMRLMLNVSFEYQEEMILALNPAKELWFYQVVDFGQLWFRIIQQEVEYGKWAEAFKSLVMAGRGIPVELAVSLEFGNRLEVIQEAKDFEGDDYFGWEIYARAPNFDELVEFMWGAHVSAKIMPPRFSRTCPGYPIRIAQNESTGSRLSGCTSINGILARGANGLIIEPVRHRGEIRRRPTLVSAILSESMAKLHELALYYNRRKSEFIRPIATAGCLPN